MAKIIIVDDNKNLRRILCDALGRQYELIEAAGGAEGLSLGLEHRDAQLIILDIVMPDLDGRQVLRQLRQHGVMTPVLLLTSQTDAETISGFIAAGIAGYVSKAGFNTSAFRAQVCGIIRQDQHIVPDIDRVYRQGPRREQAAVSVLYIADTESAAHTFGKLLPDDVFLVGVSNADAPIAFCAHGTFDLIVLDTTMDAINAEALAQFLRILQPAASIIGLFEHDAEFPVSSTAKFDVHINKPFARNTVQHLVQIRKKCTQAVKTYGAIVQVHTDLRDDEIGPGRVREKLPQMLAAAITQVGAQGCAGVTIDLSMDLPAELIPGLVDSARHSTVATGLQLQVATMQDTAEFLSSIARFRDIDFLITPSAPA